MLELAPSLHLPDDAALQRFGILAMSGAGKSNTAVVMAEEMYDAGIPWVAVDPKGDWWGVRSSHSGKRSGLEVPVFGGLQGDLPLEPTAGKLLGELVANERLTCVLDVSEFETKANQLRFLTDFAQTLLKKNRHPLMVFAEEADEYLPEGVKSAEAACVGAWSRVVKRGRFRGIFVTLITQRSAALNKNALNQVDTLIPMRTTAPHDRRAIKAWVEQHNIGAELLDSLPSLDDGEAWIWSPQKLKLTERAKFRRRRTFDSGATPNLDESSIATKLADVDLSAIEEQMAETIEKAKADDPAELRKRITDLERKLEQAERVKPEIKTVEVETPVFPESLKREIRSTLTGFAMSVLDNAQAAAKQAEGLIDRLDEDFGVDVKPMPTRAAPAPRPQSDATPAKPPPRPETAASQSDVTELNLRAGARKMLEVLARSYPTRMTRSQLATLSGFAPKGGTFNTYWGTLKRNGLLVEEGKDVLITDAGFAFLGESAPTMPLTLDERLEMWRERLREGAREMLNVLVENHPNPVDRETLGIEAGLRTKRGQPIAVGGGTFNTYLGTLKRNGLARVDGQNIYAGDALYV